MKQLFFLLVGITFLTAAQSQNAARTNQFGAFSVGFGNKTATVAAAYNYHWKLGKKQKWEIGAGIRLTSAFGSNSYYTTAPAKLTSGKTGPGVLFAENIPQNIDSVLFKRTQVNALNLSVNFAYNFNAKFSAGFNIDAIGFSFGGNQKGSYLGNNGIGAATTAKPTSFNLLLVSDNDLGSLNSEIYGEYKFNSKWGARLGFQFLFNEYTTTTKVQTTPTGEKNDRFRVKLPGVSLGVSYSFNKKK